MMDAEDAEANCQDEAWAEHRMAQYESGELTPPVTVAEDPEQAWLERRRRGIGASEVAAIVGLSPWDSPMSVWLDKIGRTDNDETEAMRWGKLLEDPIATAFEQDTGLFVGNQQAEKEHPDRPTHIATLDGLVYDTHHRGRQGAEPLGVLESKFTGDAPWAEGEIPDHYACQGQWQLHVTGLDRGWFAALHRAFGRVQFKIYEFKRDQHVIDLLAAAADQFWAEYVEAGVMPPADGSPATADALKVIYPFHVAGSEVEIERSLLDEWHKAKKAAKEAEAALELAAQQIKQLMEDNETATVDGRPAFTWKASDTERLDAEAIRTRFPWVGANTTKTTTSRRFLAKPIKEQAA